jgi:hypothetical protein
MLDGSVTTYHQTPAISPGLGVPPCFYRTDLDSVEKTKAFFCPGEKLVTPATAQAALAQLSHLSHKSLHRASSPTLHTS